MYVNLLSTFAGTEPKNNVLRYNKETKQEGSVLASSINIWVMSISQIQFALNR